MSRNIDIPCAMVLTGYVVRAPVRPAFVSPSPAHLGASGPKGRRRQSASLAPATRAPGPHAFAVRFHAARLATLVASTAFHPAFRGDRDPPPLVEWNGRILRRDLGASSSITSAKQKLHS